MTLGNESCTQRKPQGSEGTLVLWGWCEQCSSEERAITWTAGREESDPEALDEVNRRHDGALNEFISTRANTKRRHVTRAEAGRRASWSVVVSHHKRNLPGILHKVS